MHEGMIRLTESERRSMNHREAESLQLTMKRKASPGGANTASRTETRYCVNIPGRGALNGLLLEKNEEYGRTPSRPNSWTTSMSVRRLAHLWKKEPVRLPWTNKTARIFPSAEREITALRTYGGISTQNIMKMDDVYPFRGRAIEIPEEQGADKHKNQVS